MCRHFLVTLAPLLLILSQSAYATPFYCVPDVKMNFDSFRAIRDGKELAYLAPLLRPIIDPLVPARGVLQAYSFSPDGHTFTAKVNSDLKWQDGTSVTGADVARSIALAIPWRPIGKRIQAHVSNNASSVEAEGKEKPEGVLLKGDTFTLALNGDVANITGILREALSRGSMQNRIWVFRYSTQKPAQIEVLGKHPIEINERGATLKIGSYSVQVGSNSTCYDADVTLYPRVIGPPARDLDWIQSPAERAILSAINTKKLDRYDREVIGNWLRFVFGRAPKNLGFVGGQGFFSKGEPGFIPNESWSSKPNFDRLKARKWILQTTIPVYADILRDAAEKDGIAVEVVTEPTINSGADAQVMATVVTKGRLVFLQDFRAWYEGNIWLSSAPKTTAALIEIERRSAATVPPGPQALKNFEAAAREEFSIVPLGRRRTVAAVRRSSPVTFKFSEDGELDLELKSVKK